VIALTVNGRHHEVDVEPDMMLAWVLRDKLGLRGTHVCCGAGICGACTVHVDGDAQRSCSVEVKDVVGHEIITIEGLGAHGLHPVQLAWITEDVVQCGYCQSGFIMAAAAFLNATPKPSVAEIHDNVTNICRCGTYVRVQKAILRAAGEPEVAL